MSERPGGRSDLEARLQEALVDGAERQAGSVDGAVEGLAAGARARLRGRRRRAGVVGAVAAVVLVLVGVGVVAPRLVGGRVEPAPSVDDGWHTVTRLGVSVEVPDAVTDDELCVDVDLVEPRCRVTFVEHGPGPGFRMEVADVGRVEQGSGVVVAASTWVRAQGFDDESARRVLASAREAGTPPADLATWTTRQFAGLAVDVPSRTRIDVEAYEGAVDCDPGPSTASAWGQGQWRGYFCGDRLLVVTAPTRALADVVVRGIRPAQGDSWTETTIDGVGLDVPPGWSVADPAACQVDGLGGALLTPAGTCSVEDGVVAVDQGEVPVTEPLGLDVDSHPDGGRVVTGVHVVTVRGVDRETARRVLGSVHSGDEPMLDVSVWEAVTQVEPGMLAVTAVVPRGVGVDLSSSTALTDCAGPTRTQASPFEGRWAARWCVPVMSAVAPTQALADVVGSTLRLGSGAGSGSTGWTTDGVLGLELDTPAGWSEAACDVQPDSTSTRWCGPGGEVRVSPAPRPGGHEGLGTQGGTLVVGGAEVLVTSSDSSVVRRVLASVRPAGETVPDLDTWGVKTAPWFGGAVSIDRPLGAGVSLDVVQAVARCAGQPPTAHRHNGGWRAGFCVGGAPGWVSAPTQALAEVVVMTVRVD